jgi:hypothetical protein
LDPDQQAEKQLGNASLVSATPSVNAYVSPFAAVGSRWRDEEYVGTGASHHMAFDKLLLTHIESEYNMKSYDVKLVSVDPKAKLPVTA